jgi:hypothetical protein
MEGRIGKKGHKRKKEEIREITPQEAKKECRETKLKETRNGKKKSTGREEENEVTKGRTETPKQMVMLGQPSVERDAGIGEGGGGGGGT